MYQRPKVIIPKWSGTTALAFALPWWCVAGVGAQSAEIEPESAQTAPATSNVPVDLMGSTNSTNPTNDPLRTPQVPAVELSGAHKAERHTVVPRPSAPDTASANRRETVGAAVDTTLLQVPWYRGGVMPLLAVLVVIALAAWAAKRWVKGAGLATGDVIRVLSRAHLSPKQSIALVRMGNRLVFVGVTPASVTALRIVDDGDEANTICARLNARPLVREQREFEELLSGESSRFIKTLSSETEMPAESGERVDQARRDLHGLLERLRSRGRATVTQP